MGFEYQFSITVPHGLSPDEVGTALKLSGRYTLLPLPNQELALTYTGVPQRANWPEDIVLQFTETQIGAVIHSGTKHQREMFITDLSTVLKATGLHFEMEEL